MYHLSASYLCMNMYNYLYHCIPYISGQSRRAEATPSLRSRPFSLGSRIGTAPQDVESRQSSAPSSAAGSRCPHAWHASPNPDLEEKNPTKNSWKLLFLLFDPLWSSSVFEWLSREKCWNSRNPNGCSPCHVAQSEVKGPVEVPR